MCPVLTKANFSKVYLVIIVVTCYFRPLEGAPPIGEVHLIHFTPSFVTTFPVQVFAFTCAQNVRHSSRCFGHGVHDNIDIPHSQ